MSQTFTLPLSTADQFHGQERRQSRSHQKQTRLTTTFPSLPRIPSGSEVPTEHTIQHHDRAVSDQHPHHNHDGDLYRLSRAPSTEPHAPSVPKQRSFEAQNIPTMTASQHRHVSRPTDMLLHATEDYSLLHGILADQESRRIFYFMLLNLAFMGVQSTYGYLTGSLGLISDSIHMFFDCVALLVGVCAAVMAKWPPSSKFPYGYGKIDTLAGLGNGIFLMLISVEIVYEAIERLFEGSTLERTTELLFVSIAGLCVNMVGIFAFHGHHGHHHGHDHSHSGHDHSHSHDSHNHHRPSNAASASPAKPQASGGHGHHHHGSENMQGIYLHIMADALGSLAVVISTILVQFTGWSGFDPLASCIIAVLIFVATLPLVSSTTKILLLSLDSDIEYNLRDVLGGVSSIRGVVGYTVPKFWLEDIKKDTHDDHHDHDHVHDHSHDHLQPTAHGHQQQNSTAHNHNHSHSHAHHHHPSDSSIKSHCSDDHSHSHLPSHTHAHDYDISRDTSHDHADNDLTILGTIHIQISQYADLRDVQARVKQYFQARKMDVVVQYEREGDNKCWCSASGSAGAMKTPQTGGMRTPMGGSFSAGYPSGFMAHSMVGSQMKEKAVGSPLGKML